jgi:hypothetical protein
MQGSLRCLYGRRGILSYFVAHDVWDLDTRHTSQALLEAVVCGDSSGKNR